MQSYAQTYIQLLNQLQREGYSKEDLILIKNAYEMAMELFTGCYRPSGKTFIAHVVGTASILTSLHVSAKIVAAGLLHSIYAEADFGSWEKGISNTKQKQVTAVVGEEVEEYLCRYAALKWWRQKILSLHKSLDQIDPIDRDVLLIRLADQLEDSLDLGILYCSNHKDRKQFIQDMGHIMVEMTHKIGFPTLAAELEAVFKENLLAEISEELSQENRDKISFFILPKSSHRKLSVVVYQEFNRSLNYFRSHLLLIKRKLRSLYLYQIKNITS